MYKYLDRPPQDGDVVERIRTDGNIAKVGTIGIVGEPEPGHNLQIAASKDYWRVIATAPASQAKPGDTVISLIDFLDCCRSIGSIHKVDRVSNDGFIHYVSSSGYVTYSNKLKEFLLLLKADEPILNINNPTTIEEWDARFNAGLPVWYKTPAIDNIISICSMEPSKYNFSFKVLFSTSVPSCNDIVEANQQPIYKEQPMTKSLQELLTQILGAAKPTTDYDMRPQIMVVAYSEDGTEVATATADSLKSVQEHLQANKSLWGCKLVCYKMTAEMQTNVPVAVTHFDDKPVKVKPAKAAKATE